MTEHRSDLPPDVFELARRAAAYRAVDSTLFAALGEWARDGAPGSIPQLLATHGDHVGWHAELWAARLPELDEIDTGTPRPALVALLDTLTDADDLLDRLVGVYRVVLPRLATEHERLAARVDPIVDAPTARILDLVLRDERRDWRMGEHALQTLIVDADSARRAAARHGSLEALAAELGELGEHRG